MRDIQEAVDYYNVKQKGLGLKFKKDLQQVEQILQLNPFFQFRYKDVRCITMRKFPYMLHFKVFEENNLIVIYSVLCTLRDPDKYWL